MPKHSNERRSDTTNIIYQRTRARAGNGWSDGLHTMHTHNKTPIIYHLAGELVFNKQQNYDYGKVKSQPAKLWCAWPHCLLLRLLRFVWLNWWRRGTRFLCPPPPLLVPFVLMLFTFSPFRSFLGRDSALFCCLHTTANYPQSIELLWLGPQLTFIIIW